MNPLFKVVEGPRGQVFSFPKAGAGSEPMADAGKSRSCWCGFTRLPELFLWVAPNFVNSLFLPIHLPKTSLSKHNRNSPNPSTFSHLIFILSIMSVPAFSDISKASNDVGFSPQILYLHPLANNLLLASQQGFLPSHKGCLRAQEQHPKQCRLQGDRQEHPRVCHQRSGTKKLCTTKGEMNKQMNPNTDNHPVY